ncbi:hypothetical protein PR048_032320 [Dryococelus australis]|uniref:Uncharacterized protein n=1 Tax=Dryococelus australis TaxID=614101 RepID=A0ABQ9G333_9NEOP|nr:hypothetical protein PR048_032320 [Dryococelus australis]
MLPFKTLYAQAIVNCLSSNPRRNVTNPQIARSFAEGYIRAATMGTPSNSFRETGLFPYSPGIFSLVDYMTHAQEGVQTEDAGVIQDIAERPSTSQEDGVMQGFPSRQAAKFGPQHVRTVLVMKPSTSTRRGCTLLVSGSPTKTKFCKHLCRKLTRSNLRPLPPPPPKKTKAARRELPDLKDSECSDDIIYVSNDLWNTFF